MEKYPDKLLKARLIVTLLGVLDCLVATVYCGSIGFIGGEWLFFFAGVTFSLETGRARSEMMRRKNKSL